MQETVGSLMRGTLGGPSGSVVFTEAATVVRGSFLRVRSRDQVQLYPSPGPGVSGTGSGSLETSHLRLSRGAPGPQEPYVDDLTDACNTGGGNRPW